MGSWSPSSGATNGSDTYTGTSSNETADGKGGNDTLEGYSGNDQLYGSAGDDTIIGGPGSDTLSGGDNNDYIYDSDGSDTFYGGAGDDYIFDDDLYSPFGDSTYIDGGAGYDIITVSSVVGSGTLVGGADFDILEFVAKGGDYAVDLTRFDIFTMERLNAPMALYGYISDFTEFTYLRYSADDSTLASQMSITLRNSGSVNLLSRLGSQAVYIATVDYGTNYVQSGAGKDRLIGGSGTDTLDASAGDDTIDGGGGDDTLYGFIGNDQIYGGKGNDYVDAGPGDDLIYDYDGSDTLIGGDGKDTIYDDSLTDNAVASNIDAGADDDIVFLGRADGGGTVKGGAGYDILAVYESGLRLEYFTLSGFEALYARGNFITATNAQLEGFDIIRQSANPADLANPIDITVMESGIVDLSAELGDQSADVYQTYASTANGDFWYAVRNITTGEGNDIIQGVYGDDILTGNGGNDRLYGNSGADKLTGGDGNDELYGDADNDELIGGAGNDRLEGGNDYRSEEYNNGGYDILNGGDGNDILVGGDRSDIIVGGEGQDEIYGDEEYIDHVYGVGYHKGDNYLDGGAGNDWIYGGAGDDSIFGGDGNDVIYGNDGYNTAYGGAGEDYIKEVKSKASASNLLDAGDGNDEIRINDLLISATIKGGAGTDRLSFDSTSGTVSLTNYALSGLEELLTNQVTAVGRVADFAAFSSIRSTINNTALPFATLILIDGGAIDFSTRLGNTSGKITASSAGNIITTDKGTDYLIGSAVADTLVGGDKRDTYLAGDGDDTVIDRNLTNDGTTIDAGKGNDSITIDKVTSGSINGGDGLDTLSLVAGGAALSIANITISNIETFYLLNVAVTGAVAQFQAFNTIRYSANNADLTKQISITLANGGTLDLSAKLGNQAIAIKAAAAGNKIVTGGGNDSFTNSAGNDDFTGGAGNDTVYFKKDFLAYTITPATGAGPFTITGEGTDTITAIEKAIFKDGEYLFATGVFTPYPQTITGTAGADLIDPTHAPAGQHLPTTVGDTLYGLAGNDTLDGGKGPDKLYGGKDNDTYIVDPTDTVIENPNEGTDTVKASFTYTLGANVENLELTGTSAINGTGNALANVLTGNAGVNILTGLGGNDTYIIGIEDKVVEAADGGIDTVKVEANYGLTNNVEKLILAGTGNFSGSGNALANTINGNAGANKLSGGAGNDTLSGGGGNDLLIGGAGLDKLSGAVGKDSFQFDTAPALGNEDVITDFVAADDTIRLKKTIFAAIGTKVDAGELRVGNAAADANDFLVYNASTGQLYYDADGNGAGAQILVATLTGHPTITIADFLMF